MLHFRDTENRKATANITYPKDGVTSFEYEFSYKLTSFLRIKISSNLPALRVAAKRRYASC